MRSHKQTTSSSSGKPITATPMIRVSAEQFGEEPLVPFKNCMILIDGLLKFLYVFSEKDAKSKAKIDDILKVLSTAETTYNTIGGLFGMADTNWIHLSEAEHLKCRGSGFANKMPFVHHLFQIDLICDFVKKHVRDKYKPVGMVAENIPLDLVAGVYKLLEFNALPPKARQYGDAHLKEDYSATETQTQTIRVIIDTSLQALVGIKARTHKSPEISKASNIIITQGIISSTAYNTFLQIQTMKELRDKLTEPVCVPVPASIAPLVSVPVPKVVATDNLQIEGITNQDNDKTEVMLFRSVYGEPNAGQTEGISGEPTVALENQVEGKKDEEDVEQHDSVEPGHAEAKPEITYDKNYLKIILDSLSEYIIKNTGLLVPTVKQLFDLVAEAQKAIGANNQNNINEKFAALKTYVTDILNFGTAKSPKQFKPLSIEAILKENLVKSGLFEAYNPPPVRLTSPKKK